EAPPSLFDQRASAVFARADDILKNCRASDCTFTVARNLFSRREIVELLLLIRYFRMISGVMTTLDVGRIPLRTEILASLNNRH
ncbi:MAG: hypothetical protein JO331_02915, partial [Verrucomicrobia bacterium]|nr:hypothetical protein [Verrucomicrobiota bacterium]